MRDDSGTLEFEAEPDFFQSLFPHRMAQPCFVLGVKHEKEAPLCDVPQSGKPANDRRILAAWSLRNIFFACHHSESNQNACFLLPAARHLRNDFRLILISSTTRKSPASSGAEICSGRAFEREGEGGGSCKEPPRPCRRYLIAKLPLVRSVESAVSAASSGVPGWLS